MSGSKEGSTLRIRKFEVADAINVSALIRKTLIEVNSKDYPKKIIDYLVAQFTPENFIKLANKRHVIVLAEGNEIVATGAYEKSRFLKRGMIQTVYVEPNRQGSGLGRKIAEHLEGIAREDKIKTLRLTASLTGLNFWLKMGYERMREENHKQFGRRIWMSKSLRNKA